MRHVRALLAASLIVATTLIGVSPAAAAPEGQMTWAVHISLAPTWFDPAETSGIITPFMILYALHDAVVKAMPGNPMTPSLAESWTASPDGLVYEFVLRRGVKFHNGDPVTAEDVKFSFERYRGASQRPLKESVAAVETPDPGRVRFRLKRPWPDFMTFYAGATGAGWIVPKKYLEKVGDEGFKKAPIGAGPYKLVSFTPGVELVLEAFDQYWRKAPNVRRLVLRAVPDETTRLAALKRGEVDIAYTIRGALGEEVRRSPGLTLKPNVGQATFWIYFADQWEAKSPWHDRRVRLAANYAIDRHAINQAETLGYSRITWSIIPSSFEFYWQPPSYPYDPARAKRLLAEAGYANGFDTGEVTPFPPFVTMGESVANYLAAIGIRSRVRSMERATYMEAWGTKTRTGVFVTVTAAPGNAASRIENFVISTAKYATGGHPDIDDLFRQQAQERDRKKREAILHQIQRLMYDRIMYGGIFEPATLHGIGPRVEEAGVGLSPQLYFTSPWEDMRLKKP